MNKRFANCTSVYASLSLSEDVEEIGVATAAPKSKRRDWIITNLVFIINRFNVTNNIRIKTES